MQNQHEHKWELSRAGAENINNYWAKYCCRCGVFVPLGRFDEVNLETQMEIITLMQEDINRLRLDNLKNDLKK